MHLKTRFVQDNKNGLYRRDSPQILYNFININVAVAYLPAGPVAVVLHGRPQDHHLRAAGFQQRQLVLLAHVLEGANLLGHLDEPPDRDCRQIYHLQQQRVVLVLIGLGKKRKIIKLKSR